MHLFCLMEKDCENKMASGQTMFSVRIVSVDSYMCDPVPGLDLCRSEFRKIDVKSVPVVRVFGSTPTGQTTCLHLHGVFPYLMIPYCGPDMMDSHWTEIERYMQQIALSIDSALNSASGKGNSSRQRVFKISLLRGIPFYGYHEEEELFLKIYFYLPGDIKRAAELLQAGAVMNRQFQPHEAHVPYILQLFLDYNLYGMNLIHAKNCWFRLPIGKPDPIEQLPTIKRPDDPSSQDKDSSSKVIGDEGKISDLDEKYKGPTMSQFQNFNWNLLRERAQSGYSQQKPVEVEESGDGDLPSTSSSNIRKTSKDEDTQNITQSFSCSNICKSLISRTLLSDRSNDSEDLLSGTSPPHLCPLHTCWSDQTVPASSRLPTDIKRQSTCDLEVDVIAADVTNRNELSKASATNPGIASIWEDERARRKERGEKSQLTPDQSQARILGDDLSEREARYIEMLYDALDRHKEDNSLASSFDSSLSFATSFSTRKTSYDVQRRESKDLFSASPDSAPTSSNQDNKESFGLSPLESLTPIISQKIITQVMDSAKSQRTRPASNSPSDDSEDISTLELMRKMLEEDENVSVASQRGNGPLDEDYEQSSSEKIFNSQNKIKKQLSFLHSNSQQIESPDSFNDTTQPIVPSSDDEDTIENFEMSQRWDSAIQDLLNDISESENDFDVIPQIDGAADEPTEVAVSKNTVKRLGSTKRSNAPMKQKDAEDTCAIKEESNVSNTPNGSSKMVVSELKTEVVPRNELVDDKNKIPHDSTLILSEKEGLNTTKNAQAIDKTSELDNLSLKLTKCCEQQNSTKRTTLKHNEKFISARTHPECTGYTVKRKNVIEAINSIKCFGGSELQFCGASKSFDEILNKLNNVKSDLPNAQNTTIVDCKISEKNINVKLSDVKTEMMTVALKKTGEGVASEKCAPLKTKKSENFNKTKLMKNSKFGSTMEKLTEIVNRFSGKSTSNKDNITGGSLSGDSQAKICGTVNKDVKGSGAGTKSNSNTDAGRKKSISAKAKKLVSLSKKRSSNAAEIENTTAESILQKVEPKTNVFATILNENPGVTLYDHTITSKSQNYKHSAIINLDTLPSVTKSGELSPRDDTLVKIMSTPVKRNRRAACRTPESSAVEKSTRTRRPRSASKNNYLEDQIYETVFGSDWDSDDSDAYESALPGTRTSKPTRNRKCNSKKKKRSKRPRVITKWIIVNRFKGTSEMKVGLWKIPPTKRIKLTPELLRLYGLYSPKKDSLSNSKNPPPPIPTKPRPMGRRSKHRLAIRCPFGPKTKNNEDTQLKTSIDDKFETAEVHSSVFTRGNDLESVHPTSKTSSKNDQSFTSSCEILKTSSDSLNSVNKDMSGSYAETSGLHSFSISPSVSSSVVTVERDPILYNITIMEADLLQISTDITEPKSNDEKTEFADSAVPAMAESCLLPQESKLESNSDENSEIKLVKCKNDSTKRLENISPQVTITCLKDIVTPSVNIVKLNESELKNIEKATNINADMHGTSNTILDKLPKDEIVLKDESVLKRAFDKRTSEQKELDLAKTTYPNIVEELTSKKLSSKTSTDILKTHPILSSIFAKAKPPSKKQENKKRNVKFKKELKKKRNFLKTVRHSPSQSDSDADNLPIKSIMPVTSRTVEPICRKLSSENNLEEKVDAASLKLEKEVELNSSKNVLDGKLKKDLCKTTSPVKKTLPVTKKIYAPSRKVTRNSVAVKLNSISAPKTMFTSYSDDSLDPNPPVNALLFIGFPSPLVEELESPTEPPRPWSPMLPVSQPSNPVAEENDADNLLEDFAESFGTEATKMFGLVDESVFKNMDCIDQLMSENSPETTKENLDRQDFPSTSKDDDEKDLKHFDKIFEDVTESISKEDSLNRIESSNFDQFEEETLLEFIDEMTSPTQAVNQNSSESPNPSSSYSSNVLPKSPTLSQQVKMPENSIQLSVSMKGLPTLPSTNPSSKEQQHIKRPRSEVPFEKVSLSQPSHNQTHMSHDQVYGAGFGTPDRPASVTGVRQHTMASEGPRWHDRPQSCHPQLHVPQARSPQFYFDKFGCRVDQLRKDIPLMHGGYNYNRTPAFQSSQPVSDCRFYPDKETTPHVLPRSTYTPLPAQSPYPYPVDGSTYHDASQLPRPASVMDTPLQVFHTHVHHHHHVHSIDSQSEGTPNAVMSQRPQGGHSYPDTQPVKTERLDRNIKSEAQFNAPWPGPVVADVTRDHASKPEKPKSKNTQFCVPNSPFPYTIPTPTASPKPVSHRLIQTISYVETPTQQSFLTASSGKSNFYAFVGIGPDFQTQQGVAPYNSDTVTPSVIMKGACRPEIVHQPKNTTGRVSKNGGNRPKKVVWNPLPTLPTVSSNDKAKSAKTPYGLMKQISLGAQKDTPQKAASVLDRKRKTISDFRTPPPNTPTISLTGASTSDIQFAKSRDFDLSQDMFEVSPTEEQTPSSIEIQGMKKSDAFSTYNFTFLDKKLKESKDANKSLKFTINKNFVQKPSKTQKPRQKRKLSVPKTQPLDPHNRPIPKPDEELLLNFVTGEWEIVKKQVGISGPIEPTSPYNNPAEFPLLPTLASTGFGESSINLQNLRKKQQVHDFTDIPMATKRKKTIQSCDNIPSCSTPEYMVAAVDFESSSPKLKLTLKKTPTPSRGKPQLSTLVATTTPKNTKIADNSDSSDSDIALSEMRNRKRRSTQALDSDSDYKIEEISESTDDASEFGEVESRLQRFDYKAHIIALRSMHVKQDKVVPESTLICLEEAQISSALTALDFKIRVAAKAKPKKVSNVQFHRSANGRFVSRKKSKTDSSNVQFPISKMSSSNGTSSRTIRKESDTSATSSSDSSSIPVPPIKIFRRSAEIGDVKEEPGCARTNPSRIGVLKKRYSLAPTTKQKVEENKTVDLNVIRNILEQCCETVASKIKQENNSSDKHNAVDIDAYTCDEKKNSDDDDALLTTFNGTLEGAEMVRNKEDVENLGCAITQAGNGNKSCEKVPETGNKTMDAFKSETKKKVDNHDEEEQKNSDGNADPPSPVENKPNIEQNNQIFIKSSYLYRPLIKPPTKEKVLADVDILGLDTNSSSKPPFYGEASDVQTTSHRLSNLPPYVKRPKPNKMLKDLSDHQSILSRESGLHNCMVLEIAEKCYSSSEKALFRQKAAKILPQNINVWDHLDVVTKLPQYPELSKLFLESAPNKEILLKPAIKPPTKRTVEEWIQQKHEEKNTGKEKCEKLTNQDKTVTEEALPFVDTTPERQNKKPILQRSMSLTGPVAVTIPKRNRRQRVSFDLSNIGHGEKVISSHPNEGAIEDPESSFSKICKLNTVIGSTNRSIISPASPFASLNSTLQDVDSNNTMPFNISASFMSSARSTTAPEGSSSAIKTLVGSSDSDKTSSLTLFISGSFTPAQCSLTQERNFSKDFEPMTLSLSKHPQSTPNVSNRKRKHALRKLAFSPIEKGVQSPRVDITPKSGYLPSSTKSPSPGPKTSHGTPVTKKSSLRKTVLAKRFQPKTTSQEKSSSIIARSENNTSVQNSPLQLETPKVTGKKEGSQIEGPTLDNTYGFKAVQQHLGDAKSLHIVQHITTLSIELHVRTRIDLRPDPDMDDIRCLFYCINSDTWTGTSQAMKTGVIVVDPDSTVPKNNLDFHDNDKPSTSSADPLSHTRSDLKRELFKKCGVTNLETLYVENEVQLFLAFAKLVHKWDPDILIGYEVQMLSWGFLLQRAAHLRCDLCRAISRVPADDQRNRHDASKDAFGADNASELHIVGRIVLNLWRLMRTELALYDYSFESVAYHLLHERHPCYDHHTLTNWFDPPIRSRDTVNRSYVHQWRVIEYYITRVRANLKLLAQQDLIDRTSELARLFGIQFFEVLTRGTQFRVEGMMLRGARARNLVAVTPSILQRAQMRAPEVIALVMEPESKFYHVPVLVLDFQSLYPSMVIAYNICFSTCLGKVELLGSDAVFTFGCTSLRVPARTLTKLLRKNLLTVNPSGVVFVKPTVRRGVMPQMLDEILTTRIMVKNSMKKLGPDESATRRMLDHRQLGLKLIANVTYGYTAANFSGRMPCVEVGDSIVHKGRETLERAIRQVTRNSAHWENARVVYGDTDSMFVALEGVNNNGCSKQRAFEVGKEIAAAVTADNPKPVKLKFEKVYLPCVLQTKKRYVGYAFESEDQVEPNFDAKGIETVRRDGTPATAKILEKMLKILFETRDVSQVKEYVLKQCSKILDGRTTLQDCIIAKEYRGKQYYKPGAVVPALGIAKKLLAMDRRAEPRVGERVPYVIVHGAPGTPLYQLVRSPHEVLKDSSLQLNGAYYVTKQILPALDRVLSLLGVDVFLWHRQLPRINHVAHNPVADSQNATGKKSTISQFFKSKHCLMCKKLSIKAICDECLSTRGSRRQSTVTSLSLEANMLERRKSSIEWVCMQCTGATSPSEIRCISLDCPVLYKLHRAIDESSKAKHIRKVLLSEDMI